MARHTVVLDDLDGSEDARTRTFSIEDETYEIDLSDPNLSKLRDLLQPYTSAARRLPRSGGRRPVTNTGPSRPAATSGAPSRGPEQLKRVREWASANGYTVSGRGRIPSTVLAAYDEANGS